MKHHTTTETAQQTASEWASEAGDVAEQVKAGVKEGVDKLEVTIRRNPVASATAAAGIGLLLALIARR